jgi:hypothetical protein
MHIACASVIAGMKRLFAKGIVHIFGRLRIGEIIWHASLLKRDFALKANIDLWYELVAR